MNPVQHFLKFFRQLPGLSIRVLNEADWAALLSIEDREDFRTKVEEYFPALTRAQQDRMAQFLYDKNQELLREAGEDSPGTEDGEP
jgi:hypothetical protein